jgi:hypothetical protein
MKKVTLTISRAENGQHLVVVNREGFFGAPANAQVGVRIRGEDEFFGDSLFGFPFPGHVGHDGSFVMSERVSGSALDEDWGQDEIYALVNEQGFGEFRTNTVKGNF